MICPGPLAVGAVGEARGAASGAESGAAAVSEGSGGAARFGGSWSAGPPTWAPTTKGAATAAAFQDDWRAAYDNTDKWAVAAAVLVGYPPPLFNAKRRRRELVKQTATPVAFLYEQARHSLELEPGHPRRRALACFFTQSGLPRMCDQRHYQDPEIQRQVSPQARVLLGLDSPEPLSACGKFYEPGSRLPKSSIGK